MALTWRDGSKQGNAASLINTIIASNKNASANFDKFSGAIDQYAQTKTKSETDAFITQLMDPNLNTAQRSNLINQADTSFLDMGIVGATNYELNQPEKDLKIALASEERLKNTTIDAEKRNLLDQKSLYGFQDTIQDQNRDDENFNQLQIIDKEAGIASDVALDLAASNAEIRKVEAELQAAKELGLAELANEKAIELAKLEEIALKSKRDDEAEAIRVERVANQKRGIEKIRYKLTGGDDKIDIGMGSDDVESHGVLGVALQKYGISNYRYEQWSGNSMAWTTEGTNGFTFTSRGIMHKFESSTGLNDGIGGTNQADIIGHVVAAIKFDEKDQATKASQWAIWQAPTGSKGSKNKNNTVPLDARNNYTAFESFYDQWAMNQDATKQINATDFWTGVKGKTTEEIKRILLEDAWLGADGSGAYLFTK